MLFDSCSGMKIMMEQRNKEQPPSKRRGQGEIFSWTLNPVRLQRIQRQEDEICYYGAEQFILIKIMISEDGWRLSAVLLLSTNLRLMFSASLAYIRCSSPSIHGLM